MAEFCSDLEVSNYSSVSSGSSLDTPPPKRKSTRKLTKRKASMKHKASMKRQKIKRRKHASSISSSVSEFRDNPESDLSDPDRVTSKKPRTRRQMKRAHKKSSQPDDIGKRSDRLF